MTTVAEVLTMIEEAGLGSGALIEVVLPRYSWATDTDDGTRSVTGMVLTLGFGSETSEVRLQSEEYGGPIMDVTTVGQFIDEVKSHALDSDTAIRIEVADEPNDLVNGLHEPAQLGARWVADERESLSTLVFRLE